MKNKIFGLGLGLLCLAPAVSAIAQARMSRSKAVDLHTLQQQFVDLRFGMFIHFNIPTFMNQDWADPDASPAIFNPGKLDCNQWARAAKSAAYVLWLSDDQASQRVLYLGYEDDGL
jgi:alpha-L-fucosidase